MVISVFLSVCVCRCKESVSVFTTVYWKRGGNSAYIQRQQRERHSLQSHSL